MFLGEATFTGRDTLEVDGKTLRFSRAAIERGDEQKKIIADQVLIAVGRKANVEFVGWAVPTLRSSGSLTPI